MTWTEAAAILRALDDVERGTDVPALTYTGEHEDFFFLVQSELERRLGVETAGRLLADGRVWAVFPEGTRSPDGRMYRGRTGVMRVALPARVPVIPVAVTGAATGGPWWSWGRGRTRVMVEYLPALDLSPWRGREGDPEAWREATDALMARIREATGQEYADRYPTVEELAARDQGSALA